MKELDEMYEADVSKRCGAKYQKSSSQEFVCDQTKGHEPEPHRMHALRRIWIAVWCDDDDIVRAMPSKTIKKRAVKAKRR